MNKRRFFSASLAVIFIVLTWMGWMFLIPTDYFSAPIDTGITYSPEGGI